MMSTEESLLPSEMERPINFITKDKSAHQSLNEIQSPLSPKKGKFGSKNLRSSKSLPAKEEESPSKKGGSSIF